MKQFGRLGICLNILRTGILQPIKSSSARARTKSNNNGGSSIKPNKITKHLPTSNLTSSIKTANPNKADLIADAMSVAEFLKGLPSHNSNNFSQINTELGRPQKRPSVYLPTEDYPSEQHIVMDKRCVLLRYLTQQWDKKTLPRKRDHTASSGSAPGSGSTGNTPGHSCKKRIRVELH